MYGDDYFFILVIRVCEKSMRFTYLVDFFCMYTERKKYLISLQIIVILGTSFLFF